MRKIKSHWLIIISMGLAVITGLIIQRSTEVETYTGITGEWDEDAFIVTGIEPSSPAAKSKLKTGDRIVEVIVNKGLHDERSYLLSSEQTIREITPLLPYGVVARLKTMKGREVAVTVGMTNDCQRAMFLSPFKFVADIFIRLLKMLIVPMIIFSITTGITNIGDLGRLGKMGIKTIGYYMLTSVIAAATGLILVNLFKPGIGAGLGLPPVGAEVFSKQMGFMDIFIRMIPENIFGAFSFNGNMLQVIFFCIIMGFAILQLPEKPGSILINFFEAGFQMMMKLAGFILKLIPYGVFALIVKVVVTTGFGAFKPLLMFMFVVTIALSFHMFISLPTLVYLLSKYNPFVWMKKMSTVLLTALSTSSSSVTLPVTLEVVEKKGGVSNKVSSFVLPLGSTINMDGTALYECIGVIFLAQYYSSTGDFQLTFANQVYIIIAAVMASIGAAGIPSAGLIMMLTILSALGLPVEGAAILLAIDRPLDMYRTAVNVFSDTCGTLVIAKSEGEVLDNDSEG
ncbi:MAG: cation:dicarboxylase symporter family transporter [Bacteroidota bacterium]